MAVDLLKLRGAPILVLVVRNPVRDRQEVMREDLLNIPKRRDQSRVLVMPINRVLPVINPDLGADGRMKWMGSMAQGGWGT